MIVRLYSVFDAKSGAFGLPFAAFNDAVAQRTIAAAMQSGDPLFAKFPADYQLYRLGAFDDSTGQLGAEAPTAVCNLTSLKEIVHAS